MKKLTDILKEAGIEMGKVYTDKDRQPFKITEKKKDDLIYVPGIARYTYKSLKKNVERKLQDLLKRSKRNNHASIGKMQLDVLSRMWLALKDYEEKN